MGAKLKIRTLILSLAVLSLAVWPAPGQAQNFDFERLNEKIRPYTVIMEIQVEFSFGTQTNEHEQRLLGTIVSPEGLIIFDGGLLREDNPLAPSFGFSFRSVPTRITVTTLDGDEYSAEYVGVDRFTGLGFARITDATSEFEPVRFVEVDRFRLGDWLAAYVLLPDWVEPPLAADIGMIGVLVESPEDFPLTVGFNSLEFASVLYNKNLEPVGLLGELSDPTGLGGDPGGLMDSFDQGQFPLLGVITAPRLEKLIAEPPEKGKVDRSWLGITMQALTPDLADFLHIEEPGGIIVNEVVPGSPADSSELQVGDIIYAVNDQRITVDRDEELSVFQRLVSSLGPGTSVELGLYRPIELGVDSLRAVAVLAAAPQSASDAPDYEYEPLELRVRELVFSDYLNYNTEPNSLDGVVVAELQPGGLADIGGLQPGDVIQRIGDTQITGVETFKTRMEELSAKAPPEIVFFVWRFGQTLFVNVKSD